MGHHTKWRTACKLDLSDASVLLHEGFLKLVETLLCVDQLDVSYLASGELMARQLQMCEKKHRDKLQMATASGSDDAHLYLGIGQTRGHIMVCPSLQEWIGEGLRKESLVLKERCKARALQSQGGAAGKTGSPWQEALVSYEPGPSQFALLWLGLLALGSVLGPRFSLCPRWAASGWWAGQF